MTRGMTCADLCVQESVIWDRGSGVGWGWQYFLKELTLELSS